MTLGKLGAKHCKNGYVCLGCRGLHQMHRGRCGVVRQRAGSGEGGGGKGSPSTSPRGMPHRVLLCFIKPHQIQRPLDDLKHIVPPLHPCVELELGQENEQRKKEEGKGEGGV